MAMVCFAAEGDVFMQFIDLTQLVHQACASIDQGGMLAAGLRTKRDGVLI